MATIFSDIISGKEPSHIVLQNDRYMAFLERKPVKQGHVVVLPKSETDFIFDMEDDDLSGLILFSKRVAIAIRQAIPCVKVSMAVLGLQVRHAHIHLVPLNDVAELNFAGPRLSPTEEELRSICATIKSRLS